MIFTFETEADAPINDLGAIQNMINDTFRNIIPPN